MRVAERDRDIDLLDHDEAAFAHVAAVGLDELGKPIARGEDAGTILEEATVAAMRHIPVGSPGRWGSLYSLLWQGT